MNDLISRQAAIDAIQDEINKESHRRHQITLLHAKRRIENLPSEQQWIPFSMRKLTEEEKELYPEQEYILDGKTPENGQLIFVNIRLKDYKGVKLDEFYDDDGYYLFSGYEVGAEATHWMPLPEPYKEEGDEE